MALAYWEQYKVNQARRKLLRLIRMAEPEGMIRPFLDCGPALVPLLALVVHLETLNHRNRYFVTHLFDQLCAAYPAERVPSPKEIAEWSVSAQISPREQEIFPDSP